ncbi:MAG: M24 family metallopeptidase, partial [Angustibacter sp.]
MFSRQRIQYKSVADLQVMRRAGLIVGRTLELLRDSARPGMTTLELDGIAEKFIRSAGGVPSFLGYGEPPFSGTLCLSINDEVVHGVPGERRLAQGDLLSIDCGAIVPDSAGTGWHGDAAISLIVGGVGQPADEELVAVTEQALWAGIGALAAGERLFNVGDAVDDFIGAQPREYGIVEDYV